MAAAMGTTSFADALVQPLRGAANASETADRIEPPAPPAASTESATLALVNDQRASRGLAPLAWHDRVATAAQAHADDMAAHQTMSHTGSDGSNGGDRLSRTGYSWRSWGENVAVGYPDPTAVVAGWMNSPGHRAMILGDFEHAAVGVARGADGRLYWALLFATD